MGGWCSFQAACLTALGGHLPHCPGWPHACRGWSQSLGGSNVSCWLSQALPWQEEKDGLYFHGSWQQPWDGSCLWVLIPLLCPGSSVCSGAPCPAPPQGSCHSQGGIGTGIVPRHCLQLLQFLGATNISVNKEVCLFRVIFSSLLPNEHRIKAA